jgi:hypothetical protein
MARPPEDGATVTAGRLYHPPSDKSSILTLLVEPDGGEPYLYSDLNLDNTLTEDERFQLKREEGRNSYAFELS